MQFAGPVLLAPVAAADTESHRYTAECSFRLDLPPASIITVTTSATGSKLAGNPPTIPDSADFLGTKNYSTHFDERGAGSPPLYFSDQGGSFALARDEKNGSNQVRLGTDACKAMLFSRSFPTDRACRVRITRAVVALSALACRC